MPELAEVEHARRQWASAHREIVASVFTHPKARVFRGTNILKIGRLLPGCSLEKSFRSGKQLLFLFGHDQWLGVHLGMTGNLSQAEASFVPGKHDHLVIYMGRCSLVFKDPRLFGRITFEQNTHFPDWWEKRPPEILSPSFDPVSLSLFLKRRKCSPIKAVLLMQEKFPGIGNWMADEILWRSGIHPERPAGNLNPKEIRSLFKETRWVCRQALKIIGAGRGKPGPKGWVQPPKSWLFQHRWEDGGFCPRTGAKLLRKTIGGRTTCWSPARQPA